MDGIYTELKKWAHVRVNSPMAKHTTFQIGGSVDYLVEVENNEKMVEILNFVNSEGIDYFLLGGGSNLLWQDDPWTGVVLKINNTTCQIEGETIVASAGVPLALVVMTAVKQGFTGLEWAAGIPGTVGGAVRGNAGAVDSDTGRSLAWVEVWRNGEVCRLLPDECGFTYRDSIFKHNSDVVVRAAYRLFLGDRRLVLEKMQRITKERQGKYPAQPSAGSFFKNIPLAMWQGDNAQLPPTFLKTEMVPAGWVNERNGLKGYAVGGAMVSHEHGNFLINTGGATQADMLLVVEEVLKRAYTNFGVTLEPEVHLVGSGAAQFIP